MTLLQRTHAPQPQGAENQLRTDLDFLPGEEAGERPAHQTNPTAFVLLSFEGPDGYARAGGLASRVNELAEELSAQGFETHLFFVGSPELPGYETVDQRGLLHLHRWCQWISQHHPHGVYDGEEGKLWDWERSLPDWLASNLLGEMIDDGRSVVILAEEWHTVGSVLRLRQIVNSRGWQTRVDIFWNANNTFSFDRIPWAALQESATITTVSRYMKELLARRGVEALVVPNGISTSWFTFPHQLADQVARQLCGDRPVLVKVARWDPEKQWAMAIEAVAAMKQTGMRPLLLARGGLEGYGWEMLDLARDRGLNVRHADWEGQGLAPLLAAIQASLDADIIVLGQHLGQLERQVLYRAADGVLANSAMEPFGLVGLEAMAVEGIAMVGCSGEDYATPGSDCLSIQTKNPWEIVRQVAMLKETPTLEHSIRKAARQTARRYAWRSVVQRVLLPTLRLHGVARLGAPATAMQPLA